MYVHTYIRIWNGVYLWTIDLFTFHLSIPFWCFACMFFLFLSLFPFFYLFIYFFLFYIRTYCIYFDVNPNCWHKILLETSCLHFDSMDLTMKVFYLGTSNLYFAFLVRPVSWAIRIKLEWSIRNTFLFIFFLIIFLFLFYFIFLRKW